ncbi:bis(5'-nucleosyl)-tetraphosphatase PrpE [Cytobacillus dafuensis]|uniref:Bis(5'-nucleosyl)-tetraphosphatase PrpE n=1 Tax=Cytobacillus dafuensis TaxID=1742359 RepID=A0A5B8Z2Y7_CYTDA|nr:bis(5'-nucleosyl)-tetraphosphatase PrpE [Cytobacillus dafuensis]QED47251.1 bis(5'-nucleosyl)-tetraphosphatase PrpE [Cytobacillus dafuensis]
MKLDIIGDIHGCFDEFQELTLQLGYDWGKGYPIHPDTRKLAYVGDLTDRGPQSLKVTEIVCKLVKESLAYYVPGNHCNKLYRFFLGNKVQLTHGLETTASEYDSLDEKSKHTIRKNYMKLYENASLYEVLDDGKLVIAHAGIRQDYIGQYSAKVKTFVLYGDITGEKNPDGSPVRRDWAKQYRGDAIIVYGHTPVKEVRIVNNTYNIDTGAVFGNKLTALKYPEMEFVSVSSSMPFVEEKFRKF